MKTPDQNLIRASVLVRVLLCQLYQIPCIAEILLTTLMDKKVNNGAVCGGIGLYTHHMHELNGICVSIQFVCFVKHQ